MSELATFDNLPDNPSYEQLRALEVEIAKLPPVETTETHHFAHGVYGRELFIPAGSVLTGKLHRHSTLNLLIQGEIIVTTPQGMQRLTAPAVFVSPPMTKKAGLAIKDVRWVNVHATRMTDVASIEQKFIVPEEPHMLTNLENT